ncbi:MAG: hypothetical protein MJ188_04970 [Treponema sp.]|nr:hypothetical protein [Treponema sp.]
MKKIRKIFIALVVLALGAAKLSATPFDYKSAVGLYAMTSNDIMGIQYQHWFDKLGFQTQGFVFYDNNYGWNNYEDVGKYNYSVTAELQVKLFEATIGLRSGTMLYAWALAGVHGYNDSIYVNSKGEYGESNYVPGYNKAPEDFTNAVLGLGFAFDVMMFNHLSFPLQFGFTGEFPSKFTAGFTVGTGVRYKF